MTREPGTLLGWSVFRTPHRYTTSTRCERQCRLIRIPHHVFDRIIEERPDVGVQIPHRVAESLAARLIKERDRLIGACGTHAGPLPRFLEAPDHNHAETPDLPRAELGTKAAIADFLHHSHHLENHEDNQLPNDYRLTMDSHFVASMILYRHYGAAPMRIVKKPPPERYGFQQYYDLLSPYFRLAP